MDSHFTDLVYIHIQIEKSFDGSTKGYANMVKSKGGCLVVSQSQCQGSVGEVVNHTSQNF